MTPRVVLDTNVIVSGIVRRHPDAPPVRLLDAWHAGAFQLIISEDIIGEVSRTLSKPYFSARLTGAQIDRALSLLRRHAIVVPLTVEVHGVADHPEDDLVLAAAVNGAADYVITGDAGLLAVGGYQGVTIASARAFLDQLSETGP